MCIYCGTDNYRKIYKHHYGPIPREADGRTYEVHHVDGNHGNHHPDNLTAITLQEHYDIHHAQGDWFSCMLMTWQRMNKTPEEISKLASANVKKQLENGTHISQIEGGMSNMWDATRKMIDDGTHLFLNSEFHKLNNAKRLNDGTHHFLMREDGSSLGKYANQISIEKGTNKFLDKEWQKEKSKKSVKNGTHNFLGSGLQKKRVANGSHPSQIEWTCTYCCVSGKGKGNYTRYHEHCSNT